MRWKRILKNTTKEADDFFDRGEYFNTLRDSMIDTDKKACGNKEVPSDWDKLAVQTHICRITHFLWSW